MTVSEHLMRPGNGSLRFRSDAPLSITDAIRALVDENSSGVGASVVISRTHFDPVQYGDTATLSSSSYIGAITARPSRLSVEFVGISSWLDTYNDTALTRTTGTPTQWLGDILTNGLTSGTITGGSNVTRTFPAHAQTRREALDAWSQLAGLEYRVNPDLTVDVAAASTLFASPPTVVVTRREDGPDGPYRGVEGGLLDQELAELGPRLATKAVALAEGDGASIAKGTATQALSLKTPTGGTPALIKVFSAPSEESANANTAASNFLNLQGMRRRVNVSSQSFALPQFVQPGDEVYIWDPESGLFDLTNQIMFRGETISPAQVRLLSYTWPIEGGMGVYIRSNAATPTYIDVTDWVEWEDGDTWWTVGDWSPPNYGPVNRSNPEIEQRIGADTIVAWTPTITQGSAVSGTVNRGWYSKHPDGTFTARLRWTASGAGTASNAITIAMPVTLSDAQDIGGGGVFNDASTVYTVATWPNTTTSCYLVRDGDTTVLGLSSPTIASSDVIDVTITGRYA